MAINSDLKKVKGSDFILDKNKIILKGVDIISQSICFRFFVSIPTNKNVTLD